MPNYDCGIQHNERKLACFLFYVSDDIATLLQVEGNAELGSYVEKAEASAQSTLVYYWFSHQKWSVLLRFVANH